MIGQRYNDKKIAVLDVCRRYLRLRGDTEDGVDAAFLKKRMKELENGRYILAVVGEVKAGKSTFINALLGESILPTDVLQSSSAVVEIFKSDKKYVEVQYADGRVVKTVAVQILKETGAIQDRYRDIPTTLIDARIVEGSIAPGRPLPIAALEAASKLSLRDKEELIRKYVEDRTLSDIPQKITFGFPLKYTFDSLRLVDSPGVSALGGVQDTTYAYIQNANAILFVHSLESPIESSSFSDFVNNVVPKRNLETLFLVLTKSGMMSKIGINEKVREAHRWYDGKFDQHRILHVDSMLKIISNEIEQFDSIASFKEHYREQESHFEEMYDRGQDQNQEWRDEAIKFDMKLKLLNNVLDDVGGDSDRETIQAALRNSSNFDEMERIIEEFSNRAPELQLSELLGSVKSGYSSQNRDLDEYISVLERKWKHPQIFESEISKIQSLLKDYYLSMRKYAVKNVPGQHTGLQASYRESLEKITTNYRNEVNRASGLDSVRKCLSDYHDEMVSFADTIGARIRSEFENEMNRLGEKFKAEHDITVPVIDVSGIEAKTRVGAYRTVKEERNPDGFWEWILKIYTLGFKKYYEEEKVYNADKHLSLCKTEIDTAIQEKKEEFYAEVRSLIETIASDFGSALKARIGARNKELEDLKTKKETNEGVLEKIEEAKQKKKDITAELARVSDGLANLP